MKFRPWHLALITAAVVVGMAVLFNSGAQPGSVRTEGSVITRIVTRVEPDATVTFDIVLQEGTDAEHESEHIFTILDDTSIATVALDTEQLTVTVAYDSATLNEASIRKPLEEAGYLAR